MAPMLPPKWKQKISALVPRILSLLWATWAIATAAAYAHHVPPQLIGVDDAVNVKLWVVWLTAALLLIMGALAPNRSAREILEAARITRIIGISLIVALLITWTVTFSLEGGRGWVTGKNYALLAALSAYSAWTIARNSATGRVVRE